MLLRSKRSRGKLFENQWVNFLGLPIDFTKRLIFQYFLFLLEKWG
jgi:hypothetical protein